MDLAPLIFVTFHLLQFRQTISFFSFGTTGTGGVTVLASTLLGAGFGSGEGAGFFFFRESLVFVL